MTKFLMFFKNNSAFLTLSFLSGIMVGTSYIPFNGWALFFCYIPLWVLISDLDCKKFGYKKIFFASWITQFVLTLIGFNWIHFVATEFGHLHWVLASAALLLFAALMHIYIPLSVVLSVWTWRKFQISNLFIKFMTLALTLSLSERVWPAIFEWNLGYALLWTKLPMYQWADTLGFLGLSTLILIFQACLAYSIQSFKTQRKISFLTAAAASVAVLMLNVSGMYKQKQWSQSDAVVKVAVIQGNIGNSEKIQSEKKSQYQSHILNIYSELTSAHLAQSPADIIMWPETAMPFPLNQEFHNRSEPIALFNNVQTWGAQLITGGYNVNPKKHDHLGYFLFANAVFFISPEKKLTDIPYFKTNLLVFGEYMPLGKQFPILYKWLPFVGIYETGNGPQIAKIPVGANFVNFGPQICYESLDPSFSRKLSSEGAQILFNLTNDSWYGDWPEPYQHNTMNLARAIEVRRPLIRSTNTGISSAILADGTLLEQSPIGQSWAHTYEINYKQNAELSFYTQYGHWDWIIWTALLLLLLVVSRKKGTHV